MTQPEPPPAQYPGNGTPGDVPSPRAPGADENTDGNDLPDVAGGIVPTGGRGPWVVAHIARLLRDSSDVARRLTSGPLVDPDIPDDDSLRD